MYLEKKRIIKRYINSENDGVYIIEGTYINRYKRFEETRRIFQIQIGIISDGCKWYYPDTPIEEIEEDIKTELRKLIADAVEIKLRVQEFTALKKTKQFDDEFEQAEWINEATRIIRKKHNMYTDGFDEETEEEIIRIGRQTLTFMDPAQPDGAGQLQLIEGCGV